MSPYRWRARPPEGHTEHDVQPPAESMSSSSPVTRARLGAALALPTRLDPNRPTSGVLWSRPVATDEVLTAQDEHLPEAALSLFQEPPHTTPDGN